MAGMNEGLSMKVERHGTYAIVTLPEIFDLINAEHFKQLLLSLIPFSTYEKSFSPVIVDFANVKVIGSAGIGKLLMFQKRLKDRGGELKIINLKNDNIRELFNTIKLHKVINIEGLSE
jgi:anti-sigma B factor antagonist